jgi:uncharacterized membrane protein
MIDKRIEIDGETYRISIFSIWKKSLFGNSFSALSNKAEYYWRIKPAFNTLMYFFSTLKGLMWVIWVIFLSSYCLDLVPWRDTPMSPFVVLLNMSIIVLPVFIGEIVFGHMTPIDIKRKEQPKYQKKKEAEAP